MAATNRGGCRSADGAWDRTERVDRCGEAPSRSRAGRGRVARGARPGDEAPPGDAAVELLVPASLHERAATNRWKLETPQAQPRHLLVI
jgi:hypothetical protein